MTKARSCPDKKSASGCELYSGVWRKGTSGYGLCLKNGKRARCSVDTLGAPASAGPLRIAARLLPQPHFGLQFHAGGLANAALHFGDEC